MLSFDMKPVAPGDLHPRYFNTDEYLALAVYYALAGAVHRSDEACTQALFLFLRQRFEVGERCLIQALAWWHGLAPAEQKTSLALIGATPRDAAAIYELMKDADECSTLIATLFPAWVRSNLLMGPSSGDDDLEDVCPFDDDIEDGYLHEGFKQ